MCYPDDVDDVLYPSPTIVVVDVVVETLLVKGECSNNVTSKNILYVSCVIPDGPTGRTTCITLYPDASNRKN